MHTHDPTQSYLTFDSVEEGSQARLSSRKRTRARARERGEGGTESLATGLSNSGR